MSIQKLGVIAAVLVLGLPVAVSAAITEPSPIPSHLAGRDDLAVKHSALKQKFKSIEEKKETQNLKCHRIAADSPLVETCRKNFDAIMAEIDVYKTEYEAYEELLAGAENPSVYDSLLLMQRRIDRDLELVKERRGEAMLQKSRLEGIMAKAGRGEKDPRMDTEVFLKVIQGAPAGIERANAALAETEIEIKNLENRRLGIERALKNLDESKKPSQTSKYDTGFGMVLGGGSGNVRLLRSGHEGTVALGDEAFLPGDEIVTDSLGQVQLASVGALNHTVNVHADTRIKLEEDHKERGAVWSLKKGTIDIKPFADDVNTKPARIRTPDSVIQGEPSAQFQVGVNSKGETTIDVQKGRVEVREPAKGTSYFIEA